MNKLNLSGKLSQFGLEDIETDIYLYLLERGPRTPLELSRELNTDRSKIYRSIEKLTQKKLVEQSHTNWGKKFRAASPQNLKLFLQEKEEALKTQKDSLPDLIKELSSSPSYTEREFEVKHYRGQEGVRQMLWNQLSTKKEILAFSYKNKNDMVGKPYAEKIRSQQVVRKIMLYELENEIDQGKYWYTNVSLFKDFYKSHYISPKILKIKQYIAIFNDTVTVINWIDKQEIGVEIINKSFADMQRQLFWKFWHLTN